MSDNLILIDWFAMSFRKPGVTVFDIIDLLELRGDIHFEHMNGRYKYRDRLSFGGIHIYYNNMCHNTPDGKSIDDFPMLEMTGQGCREFETYSRIGFDKLFQLAKDTENYHMTRLDIAYDDHKGLFDINQVRKDFEDDNYVSKSSSGRITIDKHRKIKAISVMTGSKSSDMYMRIYDKARERGFNDGRHWIRCELVLKQDRAVEFIKNDLPIGEKFRGVIYNYFRFVEPSESDSNKRRWKMRDYWKDFLDDAEKISVFTRKDIDYNMGRLQRYVFHQAGNSIDTYIKIKGIIPFLEELFRRDSKLTAAQKYLINKCKAAFHDDRSVDPELLQAISECFTT